MSETQHENFVDCRNALLNAFAICDERYRVGNSNRMKRQQYQNELLKLETELEDLRNTGNHMVRMCKNIKSYQNKHQDKVRTILNLAIEEASRIVPDAQEQGVHLHTSENNRVTVVNDKGENVNMLEGGGYRTALGTLIRYACIKAQPGAAQFMLFDESFFAFSDATTAVMKEIFEKMKQDMLIICIEQRRNVMDGISDQEYLFSKGDDGTTTVKRVL